MRNITLEFIVGLFVAIGVACMVFLALKVANPANFSANGKNNYHLYAEFDNIGSLQVGAPVKVSGFTVGRIEDIYLDSKTYKAVVLLSINNKYHFSTDASAQILTVGLLGVQYVALQSGADDNLLKNGDHITITSSAMVLENLIGKFVTNLSGHN